MSEENVVFSVSPDGGVEVPKRPKAQSAKVLPTDRLSFDKQVGLLRAFAAVYAANGEQPVTNEKAGEVVRLSGSTVSQSNGFFCDVELLKRDGKSGFIPCTELIEYNTACQWDENEAKAKLRPVFEKTWFYRCLVPRLQLAPLQEISCLSLLANEAKAIKDQHDEKLRCLLQFLALAGIISIVGGVVSLQQNKPDSFSPNNVQRLTVPNPKMPNELSDQEKHSLYLDKEKKRKFTIDSPLFLTRAEYERVCKWIEVTLIVEDKEKAE